MKKILIGRTKSGKKYYIYQYTFLDDLSSIRTPKSLSLSGNVDEVKIMFKQHGWEGDGEIGLIWLPPFLGLEEGDADGVFVWHVKQRNNGFSWLASPVELPFSELQRQQF